RREHLPEFHEDRTEFLEREPDPLAARQPVAPRPVPRERIKHEADGPEEVRAEDEFVEPVFDEHLLDAHRARDLPQRDHARLCAAISNRAAARATSSRNRSTSAMNAATSGRVGNVLVSY